MNVMAPSLAAQPLAGIKVIDFTQVMLGPCCTQMLGDYGADVIKVERMGAGDLSRTAIEDPAGLQNPVFTSLNRNKRSIALDLKSPMGMAVVHRLLETADVVVNNFRAGVMERMGFGYEEFGREERRYGRCGLARCSPVREHRRYFRSRRRGMGNQSGPAAWWSTSRVYETRRA